MYREWYNFENTVNGYDVYDTSLGYVAIVEGRRPCDSAIEFASEDIAEVYEWCEEN